VISQGRATSRGGRTANKTDVKLLKGKRLKPVSWLVINLSFGVDALASLQVNVNLTRLEKSIWNVATFG
jgi:hypothetical protein